jgi:hypothetical protein
VIVAILLHLAGVAQGSEKLQPGAGAVGHGHRGGAIEFDDRRGAERQQPVVERHDLPPVCRLCGRGFRMHGSDGGLHLIEARTLPDRSSF